MHTRSAPLFLALVLLAAPALAGVESRLSGLIRNADLRQTRVAAVVMDLDTGNLLADIEGDEPMIPASNLKLVTSAAALDILGVDFRFHTPLTITAPDEDGKRHLIITGDGDPAFGDPKLMSKFNFTVEQLLTAWAKAVADSGAASIDTIIVDDRVFDQEFVHPSWPANQLHKWYCAQVAGLNFYDNCLDVLPVPSRVKGEAPRVELFPPSPFLRTINKATTGKTDSFWMSRPMASGSNTLTYHGSIRHRPTQPYQITLHDPPIYFAQLLAHHLGEQGVRVHRIRRPQHNEHLPAGRMIHQFNTPIAEVLRRCNSDSQNLFAEALLKRMGRAKTGQPGSFLSGVAAVRGAMSRRLGPRAAVITQADGSGMSRDNQLTARALVELLYSFRTDISAGPVYRNSLAYCGRNAEGELISEGTFRGRFKKLKPGQFVFGKSGYINAVSTCSGYLFLPRPNNAAPRVIGFSFLFNGFKASQSNAQMKQLQNTMLYAIIESLTPKPQPAQAAEVGG